MYLNYTTRQFWNPIYLYLLLLDRTLALHTLNPLRVDYPPS